MINGQHLDQAIQDFIQFLPEIERFHPAEFDRRLHLALDRVNDSCPNEIRDAARKRFFEITAEHLDRGFMQTRTRNKPLGYAGDYLVIDWMYSQRCEANGAGKLWDEFSHRLAAVQAVRNRKEFFRNISSSMFEQSRAGISVLNLACGPCRDVAEAITQAGEKAEGSLIHCVDMEQEALSYAQAIVKPNGFPITLQWEMANALRLKTARQYDLVWSAGLFDYLNDRLAAALLKKMWGWTKVGGKLIVGNFHPRNPTRNYMEWCIDWVLLHRTEDDFVRLCERAGIPAHCLSFAQEPLGAIIFCIAAK